MSEEQKKYHLTSYQKKMINLNKKVGLDYIIPENKPILCKAGVTHLTECGRVYGKVKIGLTQHNEKVLRMFLHVGVTSKGGASLQVEEWRIPWKFREEAKKIKDGMLVAVDGVRVTYFLYSSYKIGDLYQHLNVAKTISILDEGESIDEKYNKLFNNIDQFQI